MGDGDGVGGGWGGERGRGFLSSSKSGSNIKCSRRASLDAMGTPPPPAAPLDGAVRVEGVDRAHLKKQKKVERSQVRNSRGRKFEIREVAGSRLTLRFVIATRCRSQWRVPRGKQMG